MPVEFRGLILGGRAGRRVIPLVRQAVAERDRQKARVSAELAPVGS